MDEARLEDIPLDAIAPDPSQPRNLPLSLDELTQKTSEGDQRHLAIWNRLTDLATSIMEVGLRQPISVYPAQEDGKYVIYDGHRRWLALTLLYRQGQVEDNLAPCYVRPNPASEDEVLLSRLNVNLQRENFNVFELARGMQQVYESLRGKGGDVRLVREDGSIETVEVRPGATRDDVWEVVERKMGIARSRRYQIQAVLKLPPRIQRIAEEAGLPESKLRYLLPLKDEGALETLIQEMAECKMSTAQLRRRIKELRHQAASSAFVAIPKPVQIRSSIRPIKKLAQELAQVQNIPAAISAKDPRTVAGYKKLIPELQATIVDLEKVLAKLKFLDAEE